MPPYLEFLQPILRVFPGDSASLDFLPFLINLPGTLIEFLKLCDERTRSIFIVHERDGSRQVSLLACHRRCRAIECCEIISRGIVRAESS